VTNEAGMWGALRPMTPDGYPAYAQSATFAGILADCILAGRLSDDLTDMHPARFAGRERVHAA